MQIGSHMLACPVIAAPMAGVSDRPWRNLCRRFGAGLAVSEMVASNRQLWGTEKSRLRLDHEGESAPISVQIAGSDPSAMAAAARFNVERGAQIIDINMGCPAKKVCNVAAGSALLRDEDRVARILAAVVGAVDVPVTLKIRTGWSLPERNAVRIAAIAEHAGVQALAVHGRTRACAFSGHAEYRTIAEVKRAVKIPVVANGDITSADEALAVLAETGADAVMIGRAAQGRPWVFSEVRAGLQGARLPPPAIAEVRATILSHLEEHYSFYGEDKGVRTARKHLGWYSKGLLGGEAFRREINVQETSAGQMATVVAWFQRLEFCGMHLAHVAEPTPSAGFEGEEALAA